MLHFKNTPPLGILFFPRIVLVLCCSGHLLPSPSWSSVCSPCVPPTLLTRAHSHGYYLRSKNDSHHLWTDSYQMVFPGNLATVHVRAAQHAKICLPALPGVWCNLYSTASAPSPAASHLSSLSPAFNTSILNSSILNTTFTERQTLIHLSKGMPSQPGLVNNKPWWRRRTCLSGWLPGERNDLLQPSKQQRSEMGTKGQPSGSWAA